MQVKEDVDYFLYLAASHSTIGMVLVQEDEFSNEHVIYYLSRNLHPTELKYSHVEKLALVAVQAVQRFHLITQNHGNF